MAILGIDLGTSNTLVATMVSFPDGSKKPQIMPIDGDHREMLPSVVFIDETAGHPDFGKTAVSNWMNETLNPEHCFRRWKMFMGENATLATLTFADSRADKLVVTPELLTTMMVEHLLEKISHGAGGEEIESILVTVPHGWRREKAEKCRATRLAASRAKLNDIPVAVQEFTVSEPVAAAAYWLWEADQWDAFSGKSLLVCDIGGGTFDLSLVRIMGKNQPLVVIDAVNSNYAGDYVDALVTGWICRQFNEKHGTSYPVDAEGILHEISGDAFPWMRKWFSEAKGMKEELCGHIARKLEKNLPLESIKPSPKLFSTDEQTLKTGITADQFVSCLKPFYEKGSDLIHGFLEKSKASQDMPYAVVFSGGASRIHGVRDYIVRPVLREFYQSESEKVLNRIVPNDTRLDLAIAYGAALIANGVVSVQERLLHDIGVAISVMDKDICKKLGIEPGSQVFLTPVLKRGTPLDKAYITSKDFGINFSLQDDGNDEVQVFILIDDDPVDPWIQDWTLPHPGGEKTEYGTSLYWTIKADSDGVLSLTISSTGGSTRTAEGKLQRERKKGVTTIIAGGLGKIESSIVKVTPERFKEIQKEATRL